MPILSCGIVKISQQPFKILKLLLRRLVVMTATATEDVGNLSTRRGVSILLVSPTQQWEAAAELWAKFEEDLLEYPVIGLDAEWV